MTIVNWTFLTNHEIGVDQHPACIRDLISKDYNPFKSLSKEIIRSRKGSTYLKCPAHTDFLKNTFVFCAPFDLTIDLEIDPETDLIKIYCENISQEIFNTLIDVRFLSNNEKGNNPYPLIGIDWLNVVTCEKSLMVQVFPAFMHRNEFTEKTTVIPGEYDISKWTRPVEVVFEIRSNREKIVIKKGDALSYFKFLCDDQIKLVKNSVPWQEIIECNEIVKADKNRPLKERYSSLEKIRANKCPYDHN